MAELEIQSASSEYLGALASVRLAKTLAWLVILLALTIQVSCFALAITTNLLDAPSAAQSQPASAPAIMGIDLRHLAIWLLPVTKFAGFLAALVLPVLLLAATQISLVGRLGGARGYSSAFVWSIVLLLTLVPWQQFLGGLLGAGVLAGSGELQAAVASAKPDWAAGKFTAAPVVTYMGRFFAYPFVVLILWIIVGMRCHQGARSVREATTVATPEPRQ